jgi:hypothetical protein
MLDEPTLFFQAADNAGRMGQGATATIGKDEHTNDHPTLRTGK